MDKKVLEECLIFFEKLEIQVRELTSPEEQKEGIKVVEVNYNYLNKVFTTKPLYYREVLQSECLRDPIDIRKRFGGEVFILDLVNHDWPQPSGESDLERLVIDDMVKDGDDAFRSFLFSLGNNRQSGFIQKMTRDGQPGQYYHNLMNNNHWHDLVLLIKAAIKAKGNPVDKSLLSPLIFKWIDGKRVSMGMRPYNWDYKIIYSLYQNIQSVQMNPKNENIIKLLEYKKQIILQGPPGTGKTKLAKELAQEIIGPIFRSEPPTVLLDEMIVETLAGISDILTVAGNVKYKIVKVDALAKQVTLEDFNGSKTTVEFQKIRSFYDNRLFREALTNKDDKCIAAIAKFVYKNLDIQEVKVDAFSSDQFELIQFHPSYNYEDFVRGIVSSPSEDKKGIVYEAENKTLAMFAKRALDNWESNTNPVAFKRDNWLWDTIDQFLLYLNSRLHEENGKLMLTPKAYITRVTTDSIRYNSDVWDIDGGVPIIDIKRMYEGKVNVRNDVIGLETLSRTAKHLPTYWFKIYELFLKFIADNELDSGNVVECENEKKYVLIIDEINRANLSSVLGEAIYALEYRGQSVKGMYGIDGDYSMTLPPNLYIIGTMNTADRSVGYIDYAIRRRFAFVDVAAEDLIELGDDFDSVLFNRVKALFTSSYLAPEFKAKDVQLGHSYFIRQYEKNGKGENEGKAYPFNLRIQYEILPLLREYVADGVLNEKAAIEINAISKEYLDIDDDKN